MTALIDLHFLPCIEYFCALRHFDAVLLERHEHYVKQSYRNRCYINTAHGIHPLIVPLTGKHGKVAIGAVRIDYSTPWQNLVWRTLEAAYRKAPFFEHYESGLHRILYSRHELLFDLNRELLSFCLKSVGQNMAVAETVSYVGQSQGVIDLRSLISAKKKYEKRSFYVPVKYYQVFGNDFAPNLSLIDLLFGEGPRATQIILESGGAEQFN